MNEGKSARYLLISADGHAGADLWDYKPYLEQRYHDDFDAWAGNFSDAWGALDGASSPDHRVGAASFGSDLNWDSDKREKQLESQGIAAEVLFPNTAPPFFPSGALSAPGPTTTAEYEYRSAGLRAHNRWLADFCNATSGRRAGVAQIFLTDVDEAIKEARWAKEAGLMGILLPGDHLLQLVNLYYPKFDPLWAECAELGLPVHRHGILPCEAASPEAGGAAPAIGILESFWLGQRALGHTIMSGVFERHPQLKFVFTELTAAWSQPYVAQLDGYFQGASIPGSVPNMFGGEAVQQLSRKPSEFCRSNVFFGTFLEAEDIRLRHEIGIDRLMWGADFPHHEGTSPYTAEALRCNFAGLPEDEIRRITSLNAAAVYGFDLDLLQAVADRIGPTVTDVAVPLPADQLPKYPVETLCPTFTSAVFDLGLGDS